MCHLCKNPIESLGIFEIVPPSYAGRRPQPLRGRGEPRRVGLLNGVFDRYRFRFGGFGSWHCFGGSDDRTRLGSNDDNGTLRPLQLRRRADCRGGLTGSERAIQMSLKMA